MITPQTRFHRRAGNVCLSTGTATSPWLRNMEEQVDDQLGPKESHTFRVVVVGEPTMFADRWPSDVRAGFMAAKSAGLDLLTDYSICSYNTDLLSRTGYETSSSDIHEASTLLLRTMRDFGGPRYEVLDIGSLVPLEEAEEADFDIPIFRAMPTATIFVKAKVTVTQGRLSLVLPEVLEEGD